MRPVRLFLWLLGIVVLVMFAITNWHPVALHFNDTDVLIRLPVLLVLAGLCGFVPMYVAHRVARRRWTRERLASNAAAYPANAVAFENAPAFAAVPPPIAAAAPAAPSQGQPTCVPPGVG